MESLVAGCTGGVPLPPWPWPRLLCDGALDAVLVGVEELGITGMSAMPLAGARSNSGMSLDADDDRAMDMPPTSRGSYDVP